MATSTSSPMQVDGVVNAEISAANSLPPATISATPAVTQHVITVAQTPNVRIVDPKLPQYDETRDQHQWMAKCLRLFAAFAVTDKKAQAKWMMCAMQGTADAYCTYEVPEADQNDSVKLYEKLKQRFRNPTDPYFYR